MAARKKAPKRKPARKRSAAKRKAAAPRRKTTPRRSARQLPNDDAWRELVETAIEHLDPAAAAAPRRKSK
jgi:hypothetical protein